MIGNTKPLVILMRYCFLPFVVLVAGCYTDRLAKLEKDNQELQAQLKQQQQKATTLDLQEKCSKQAAAAFTTFGYKEADHASYTNHYNVRVNKCFIETYNMGPRGVEERVYDAFELQNYGVIAWLSNGKASDDPWPCQVTIPSGEMKMCHSFAEFDDLVKPYMEQ
jgi:hypothetical protein